MKGGINNVLNLNTTWTAANFLNYIEHSFFGTTADWYDLLYEHGKNTIRLMETPAAMFKNFCMEIETKFIGAKFDSEEKARAWQRKINNIELWDLKIILLNLVNIITKLGIMKPILVCSMTNYYIRSIL